MMTDGYKENVRQLQKESDQIGNQANSTGPETDSLFALIGQQVTGLQELHGMLASAAQKASEIRQINEQARNSSTNRSETAARLLNEIGTLAVRAEALLGDSHHPTAEQGQLELAEAKRSTTDAMTGFYTTGSQLDAAQRVVGRVEDEIGGLQGQTGALVGDIEILQEMVGRSGEQMGVTASHAYTAASEFGTYASSL